MSEPLIRAAEPRDAIAIATIYNHYVVNSTATFDTVPKSAEDREWWLADRDPRHVVVVAEQEARVVGWASLGPYRERPAWALTAEVAVYVAEEARGSGIGTALLGRLVDDARTHGLHALVSQVVGGNAASIRMAERLGFVRVGTLVEVGHKFDEWLDVVILQLVLDDAQAP